MVIPGVSLASTPRRDFFPTRYTVIPSFRSQLKSYFALFPVVVAEVTQPSLGVGYELGWAVALGKQILCLFRPQSGRGEHPSWLSGNPFLPFPVGWAGSRVWTWSQLHFPSPVLSAMIRGAADGSRIQVWDYTEGEVDGMLDRYFETYPPEGKATSSNPST